MSFTKISLKSQLVEYLMKLAEELDIPYDSKAGAVSEAIRERIRQLHAAKINRMHLKAVEVKG